MVKIAIIGLIFVTLTGRSISTMNTELYHGLVGKRLHSVFVLCRHVHLDLFFERKGSK